MRRASSSSGQAKQRQQGDEEKSNRIRFERTGIVGLTLMFEERAIEKHWQAHQLKRNFGISVRFLFFASLFQGLFVWSDVLEQQGELFGTPMEIHLLCMRILLGGFSLLSCFLVSTGLLLPTQVTIFWVNLIYGLPTIAVYYLTREKLSHWDSLYIVYGLSFFMLPKLSPLNFIYGFAGSTIVTIMFIYISAFRLSLNQWLLSNTLLLVIFFLFMYVSYSFEKSSRERWMLRERLKREKINLDLVASSIHDDLKKTTSDKRAFRTLDEIERETYAQQIGNKEKSPLQLSTDLSHSYDNTHNSINSTNDDEDNRRMTGEDDNAKLSKTNRQSMNQFFKGLGAWALLLVMGNAFDFAYKPISYHDHQVDSSAVSALMMHSVGFSVFLLYFTGQIRWLILNGAIGLVMLWIFNATGIDNKWVLVSTHSVGYVVLATTIIIMILVFGGVVLVWSNLIDFLKDILVRYPQVKDELSQKKVLEQVLIRYISDIPKTEVLHPVKIGKSDDSDEDEEIAGDQRERSRAHAQAGMLVRNNRKGRDDMNDVDNQRNIHDSNSNRSVGDKNSRQSNCDDQYPQDSREGDNGTILEVLSSRKPNCCYFCLKSSPSFLVPACRAWNPRSFSKNDSSSGENGKNLIPLCTPYQSLALTRDELTVNAHRLRQEIERLKDLMKNLQESVGAKDASLNELNANYKTLEAHHLQTKRSLETQLAAEQHQREVEVQSVISQHNAQLTDLKRLHKAFHATQLQAMKQLKAQSWISGHISAGETSLNSAADNKPCPISASKCSASAGGVNVGSNSFVAKKKIFPPDRVRNTDRNRDKIKEFIHSNNKNQGNELKLSSTTNGRKISAECDMDISPGSSHAHHEKSHVSIAAKATTFQGSLESFDSFESKDSVTDTDELSKFFKASIEEIEELLRSCISYDCESDLESQYQESQERIVFQQQSQHVDGPSRMKYAMNF